MNIVVSIAIIVGVVIGDQLIKLWATANLMGNHSIMVIPGLLKLTYVENYGAAFGMMGGMRWFLIALTSVMLFGLLWALYKEKVQGLWMKISVTMIIAGGLGNLIDRIRLGYVVDYLDVNELFTFPMFNLADCFVVTGAFVMIIYVLLIEPKEQKNKEN